MLQAYSMHSLRGNFPMLLMLYSDHKIERESWYNAKDGC